MPRKGYQNLTLGQNEYKELRDKFDKLSIAETKNLSFTRWVIQELALSLEKQEFLKRFAPALTLIGVHQDSILINDAKQNTIAQVSLRNGVLYCSIDKSDDCNHIHYALILSELGKICNIKPRK